MKKKAFLKTVSVAFWALGGIYAFAADPQESGFAAPAAPETGGWSAINAPVEGVKQNPIPINAALAAETGHIFNYVDEKTGDYFIDAIGKFHGFKSMSAQVTSMTGPDQGPPVHRHSTEELFVVLEGTGKFFLDGKVHVVEAPAMVYIPEMAAHNVTSAGDGKNTLVTFYPTNQRTIELLPIEDRFAKDKQGSHEIELMSATYKSMIAHNDQDGDGRLNAKEIPAQTQYDIHLFDGNQDGFLDMKDIDMVR